MYVCIVGYDFTISVCVCVRKVIQWNKNISGLKGMLSLLCAQLLSIPYLRPSLSDPRRSSCHLDALNVKRLRHSHIIVYCSQFLENIMHSSHSYAIGRDSFPDGPFRGISRQISVRTRSLSSSGSPHLVLTASAVVRDERKKPQSLSNTNLENFWTKLKGHSDWVATTESLWTSSLGMLRPKMSQACSCN